jgi:hypothetical protein
MIQIVDEEYDWRLDRDKALARIATLEAALAEVQRTIEAERQGWKIALRTIINEPQHASIIGNPASIARAEIDEIGASLVALAEAREDSARLEWASANPSRWGKRTDWIGTSTGEWWAIDGPGPGTHSTLRAAIDAARGGKP